MAVAQKLHNYHKKQVELTSDSIYTGIRSALQIGPHLSFRLYMLVLGFKYKIQLVNFIGHFS
jgi:hypothetical protein